MQEHNFTPIIKAILEEYHGDFAAFLFAHNPLIQYLNLKTRSASKGSKSRSAFANHYALYVLIEDYAAQNFDITGNYNSYEGAKFTDLLKRQRTLPFGSKLQNHALNHRLNEEFKKFFPTLDYVPVIRNIETNRYWINQNLLVQDVGNNQSINLARAILKIIEAYIQAKKDAFETFLNDCKQLRNIENQQASIVITFLHALLRPNVDARIFEIVSYAILKEHYRQEIIYWGWSRDDVKAESLNLYKTGRTNANDGGIDLVMKPLGRFFQVTETLDAKKYFLDIDKIQKFPITFVIKTDKEIPEIKNTLEAQARHIYQIQSVVVDYMNAIEEIINIPILLDILASLHQGNRLSHVIDEIILQSSVEFNY